MDIRMEKLSKGYSKKEKDKKAKKLISPVQPKMVVSSEHIIGEFKKKRYKKKKKAVLKKYER